MENGKRVELLAPAGNAEGFYGAIHAGADAVYLGGSRFGARAYADNFTEEELVSCIRYAHLLGRRVYLTLNTLIKEKEMDGIFPWLLPYYEAGLDGVIIQDLGVFAYIREHFPGLELHVSTQMAITGWYGAAFLKGMGAVRIVPARELGLEEIQEIKRKTGLEIETFIHGAMCYCYSGQCLFSSILGGRSGNRGRCAQPCRLPYSVRIADSRTEPFYPLSLKDMCTIERIPELIEAGIDSFKIEGRMKKPEYAAGATAIYRKYIDLYYEKKKGGETFEVEPEDLRALTSLYIRSERQEGYYFRQNGRDMVTLQTPAYESGSQELLDGIRRRWIEQPFKIPADISAEFSTGKRAEVCFTAEGLTATAWGEEVQRAQKKPISRENAVNQLRKLGASIFDAGNMEVKVSPDAFYPLKQINDLRRDGVEQLEKMLLEKNGYGQKRAAVKRPEEEGTEKYFSKGMSELSVSVHTLDQLKGLAGKPAPDRVYVNGDLLFSQREKIISFCREMKTTARIFISLPYILRNKDQTYMETLLALSEKHGELFEGYLVRSLEGLGFLHDKAYAGEIHADAGLYCWNSQSLRELVRQGRLSGFCLPYELNGGEQQALLKNAAYLKIRCEKIIYGRIPMMITANCIAKTCGSCRKNEGEEAAELTDRYKKRFPTVLNCLHCMNIIYNSVPLSLHRGLSGWMGKCDFRLDFTTESAEETASTFDFFKNLTKKEAFSAIAEPPFSEYTTGHEKRGVL